MESATGDMGPIKNADDIRAGRHRVVQVWVASKDASDGTFGSGYAIGDDLVLTADHLLSESGWCDVRPYGGRDWFQAEVVWRGHDVALLAVSDAPWGYAADRDALRWARVRGARPLPCTVVGFPWSQAQPDNVRETEALVGEILPGTTVKSGRYAVHVTSGAPTERPGGSPWQGMSGAALLAMEGRYLLGIVVSDPPRYGRSRLVAVSVAVLLADSTFTQRARVDLGHIDDLPSHPFAATVCFLAGAIA
jgi:hypothetical protein